MHIDEILSVENAAEYVVTGTQIWDHMLRHGYLLTDFRAFQREVECLNGGERRMCNEYCAGDVMDWLGY